MTPSIPRHRTRPVPATNEAQPTAAHRPVESDGDEQNEWVEGRGEYLEPYQEPPEDPGATIATLDQASEEDIFRALMREHSPRGVVETAWCRDLARNIHHATRLRSIRDSYLNANRKAGITDKAIRQAIPSNLDYMSAESFYNRAHQLLLNGPEVAEAEGSIVEYRRVAKAAKNGGFDVDQGQARAYFAEIYKFESIEKMIVLTDTRRDNIFRDLEKRRPRRPDMKPSVL